MLLRTTSPRYCNAIDLVLKTWKYYLTIQNNNALIQLRCREIFLDTILRICYYFLGWCAHRHARFWRNKTSWDAIVSVMFVHAVAIVHVCTFLFPKTSMYNLIVYIEEHTYLHIYSHTMIYIYIYTYASWLYNDKTVFVFRLNFFLDI